MNVAASSRAGRRPIAIHIVTRLIRGGPTRPVLAALGRLSQIGYRPVLITGMPGRYEDEALDVLDTFPDLPVLRMRVLRRAPQPFFDCRALAGLAGAAARLRPAVVHTHTAKAGALGRVSSRFARGGSCRRIHTFHGHSLTRESSGRMAPLWRAIERLLLWGATDLLITLSPGQRDEIVRRLGPRAARLSVVLPLSHDPTRYAPAGQRTLRVGEWRQPGERLLAFLGRGVRVKGLEGLARAHARLAARDRARAGRLRLIIVGPMEPGVLEGSRSVLAHCGLGAQWHFIGSVPNPLSLLPEFDGLVLPSLSEGTPVSIIEAFDAGLPVIASAVGGVPEMLAMRWERSAPGVWHTRPCAPRGLLLPVGETDAWAAALERFVDDPASVPGNPLARQTFVREVFDPDQGCADLDALYRRVGARVPASTLNRPDSARGACDAGKEPVATAPPADSG